MRSLTCVKSDWIDITFTCENNSMGKNISYILCYLYSCKLHLSWSCHVSLVQVHLVLMVNIDKDRIAEKWSNKPQI